MNACKNWISDIKEGLGLEYTPLYYNDKHLTFRRIKFFVSRLSFKQMVHLQAYIEAKRPDHSVQLVEWFAGPNHSEYCVYYRPKILKSEVSGTSAAA